MSSGVQAQSLSARDLVRVPGLLSLSRVPLAALFPRTIEHPRRALALLAVAGATDLLDGWVARRFHQQTSTGALIDGVTDKVFVLTVVGSLVLAGSLSVTELVLLGTRDLGELALGLRLAGRKRHRRLGLVANAGGKAATTLQYLAIGAVLLKSKLRRALIDATAIAGVVASVSYWRREVRGRAV